jgi:hypothetical protein
MEIAFMACSPRTSPEAHLISYQKLPLIKFLGAGFFNSLQQCQLLHYKVEAQATEVPDWKLQQVSDSQPVTLPNHPQIIYTGVHATKSR